MQTQERLDGSGKRLPTSRTRYWKSRVSPGLRAAMDECVAYALEAHNRSIERIAERMGLESKWVLYKWIAEQRMPANMIPPFEHACGIDLVTRYLAVAADRIAIEIPRGRQASAEDMQALQTSTNTAIGALLAFYAGSSSVDDAVAAVRSALQDLGWHHANVCKAHNPELELSHDGGK